VIVGFSGALLVFKDDYLRLVVPEARVSVPPEPARFAAIAENAEAVWGAHAVRSIRFARPDFGLSHVRLHSGDQAYLDAEGHVVTIWSGSDRIEEWVFDLHHQLLSGSNGEVVIGLAGLLATALILTGVIAVWPARRALGWRIWPRTKARIRVLQAHRNLGLIAAVPLLLFTVTGASLVFKAEAIALMSFLDGDRRISPAAPPPVGPGMIDWGQAFEQARLRFPNADVRIAIWPRPNRQEARIRVRQPDEWHPNGRTTLVVDPSTSHVVAETNAHHLPRSERVFNSFYPLHAAHLGTGWLGRGYDVFSAAIGLGLSLLGAFGIYAFVIKRRSLPGLTKHSQYPGRQSW